MKHNRYFVAIPHNAHLVVVVDLVVKLHKPVQPTLLSSIFCTLGKRQSVGSQSLQAVLLYGSYGCQFSLRPHIRVSFDLFDNFRLAFG